jgi:asparagine synthase (glutamine-hydrolysing)
MFFGFTERSRSGFIQNHETTSLISQTLAFYNKADQKNLWQNKHACIAQALTYNTPFSRHETAPWQCPASQLVICSWLRLDNRASLAESLNLSLRDSLTDPMLVIAAYRQWGNQCADYLEGDFSFVIYNPETRTCFAARDSLGVKPFYYYIDNQVFIFSSTAALFPRLHDLSLQPDLTWIAHYLVNQSMSFTATGFAQVYKLAPAHQLEVTPEQHHLTRYFTFRDNAPADFRRDPHWVSDYRAQLDQAVQDRLRSDYLVGSETSGGIDSSTITALAALHLPHPKNQFHVFGLASLADEPDYILATSQLHGILHNHIYTQLNPEITESDLFEREMRVLGYPCEHSNATAYIQFYQMCQQFGIRTLLSGFGGDEVGTNPGHLLWLELLDARRYKLWYQNTPPGNPIRRLLHMAKQGYFAYQRQQGRYQSHVEQACVARMHDWILSAEARQQYQVDDHYRQAIRYDADYRSINAFILGDRLAPFVPTRLDNCTLMAASFQVDYRWPLLDRRLIQQYLNTPAIEKYSSQASRYLHRRAVTDILPHKVCWKTNKYMGELVNPHISNHLIKKKYAKLAETALHPCLERLVDPDKLQTLANRLSHAFNVSNSDFNSRKISILRQAHALKQVNQWLHYYF